MAERLSRGPSAPRPLRVLSLDGGGIRGISSILILENLMEKIREVKGLKSVPRPCEYFDLIGGTSTGGIIAIMLGRLGMTATECVRAYTELAQQAFTPKKTTILPASPAGAYSAKALESAIMKAVRTYCVVPECSAKREKGQRTTETCPHSNLEFEDKTCTKTVVLAITKNDVDAPPTLFTTYDMPARFRGSTICQVARATSAATTFFKPATVGREGIEFVDAAFGYNNPCEVLIEEAQRQFPDRKHLQVVSIGTGLGDVVSIKESRRSIIVALKKMATSSKEVATRLDKRYGDADDCEYYRLNVEQGLQDITLSDWEKAKEISGHTHNYLEKNQRVLERIANTIAGTSQVAKLSPSPEFRGLDPVETVSSQLARVDLDEAQLSPPSTSGGTEPVRRTNASPNGPRFYLPLPRNKRFVGRGEVLRTVQRMLFEDGDCGKAAIVGLGGMGKTQIALQLAYWTKEKHPEYSIFWVPILSNATFDQAYTEIAKRLPLSKPEDGDEDSKKSSTRQSVLEYLSSEESGPWLLIVDNADDNDLYFDEIDEWIPESEHGRVLLTTRSQEVAVSFAGADSLVDNAAVCKELLDELTYLPLAISQAAAYLNTNKQLSITEYLGLLRKTEQSAVGLLSRDYRDKTRYAGSQNAVAITWLVSFEQIRRSDKSAAKLLEFLSCIEPKSIPGSILPKLEPEEMTHAIGTLCGYSFLTKRGATDTYDMHSLVHLATRLWVQRDGRQVDTTRKAIEQLDRIFPYENYENRELWRNYLPHAIRALRQAGDITFYSLSHLVYMIARCLLFEDGRDKESLDYASKAFNWARDNLPKDHRHRSETQEWLAAVYGQMGRSREAIELLEQLMAGYDAQELAADHPDRMQTKYELARAYRKVGEKKKAVEMLENMVDVDKYQSQDEAHPERLDVEHLLAKAYLKDSQVTRAMELHKKVLAIRSRTLADDHPDRLGSEHELAMAYRQVGENAKAIELLERVVATSSRTLPEENLDRLESEHALAMAYYKHGQIKKGREMMAKVVAVKAKVLPEGDPSRLQSEDRLAEIANNQETN
ncbi:acyl transferase/acyl hydrolase/lysophospholipase [Cercophora newfieldiana]|uniref:Acyl transferase/acyl hydrolase/lysophospholipase n=1 Tax=Cercophora newfieldiana TaxID=92897 RepID=A0AA40CI85_9PEZI|nr:acyl transferase/acyl hydrolase/lysophospholipase [Cercophora newfieldiana]